MGKAFLLGMNFILCRSLGARHGINYKKGAWLETLLELTPGRRGVDVLVDYVGAPYWQQNIGALALDGRMVCCH